MTSLTSGLPQVVDSYVASGGLVIPVSVGNQYAAVTLNSASGTGAQLMITGAPGYYMTEFGFQCDPTATLGSAGMETINFVDSSFGTVAAFRIYIPSTAAALPSGHNHQSIQSNPIQKLIQKPILICSIPIIRCCTAFCTRTIPAYTTALPPSCMYVLYLSPCFGRGLREDTH